ncbi:efflux transporter outer membrane subunit [Pseudoduganella sp. DS3]|uniref:Efflux transporter outer membrane subunit n=1 Tax=Pseudoduganella guangdongensis TaxID=2692179 RepID=A0A6N9HI99_9BURK|nr:efflux transporter outer membrane subunit [Pseudoduganella guangdongensis]MYN03328.1 efflux transporter outer membrane subunit [Pseudoduganella guangdongensis]
MTSRFTFATLMATATLLAGCASDGGLRPQASMAQADRLAAAATLADARVSPAAWPAANWWQRYGDAQLDQLVAEALAGSPNLRIAQARVRQAQAAEGLAEAAGAPQLGAAARSTRQLYSANSSVPKPLAGSWQWSNEATLNFSYELDFWGKHEAALAAAVGRRNAAEVDAQASRLMLEIGVTQAYLRLSQAHAQLELAQSVLKQREHVLQLTRQRVAAQLDSSVDLKQAELAIPVAREQIAAAKEAVALLRTQLAALLGAGPDRGAAIARPQLQAVRPAGLPGSLPSELLARRPDVVAQRWRVEAQLQDIKAAQAQFYPSFNLAGLVGLQSLGFGKFLQGGSQLSALGGGLSLPIFDGGRLRHNLALRNADYDLAVEQYNQTLVDALRDVVSQLTSIQWLQERAAYQAEALATAQQGYALAVQRYQSGLGNYLQVLAAQNQVLAQQRARIDFDARAFDLDMNLVRALGGGY